MIINITKGKLLKGDKIEVEYSKQSDIKNKPTHVSEECSNPPHADLRKAFSNLAVHAALLGEFIAPVMIRDIEDVNPDLVSDYTVTGFTITGKDETEGVIISAQKKLKSGKTLGFNTPTTRFESEGDGAYEFIDDLATCIDFCKSELKEYLNGKYAPDPQLQMALNEDQSR